MFGVGFDCVYFALRWFSFGGLHNVVLGLFSGCVRLVLFGVAVFCWLVCLFEWCGVLWLRAVGVI